jgi:hypothetical protein
MVAAPVRGAWLAWMGSLNLYASVAPFAAPENRTRLTGLLSLAIHTF